MLLLHHDHHKNGASGRTRTDDYEFTKLVLSLLTHRGYEICDLRSQRTNNELWRSIVSDRIGWTTLFGFLSQRVFFWRDGLPKDN
jgi:hypothetical protein